MESLRSRVFGTLGNRRAFALDYMPTMRTICRLEQLKEQGKVKRRWVCSSWSTAAGVKCRQDVVEMATPRIKCVTVDTDDIQYLYIFFTSFLLQVPALSRCSPLGSGEEHPAAAGWRLSLIHCFHITHADVTNTSEVFILWLLVGTQSMLTAVL